jgi:hypothetical protein
MDPFSIFKVNRVSSVVGLFKKLNLAAVNIVVEQIVLFVVNSKLGIAIAIVRTIIV